MQKFQPNQSDWPIFQMFLIFAGILTFQLLQQTNTMQKHQSNRMLQK